MADIAILAGSFKPPHLGHLKVLNDLISKNDKVVVFVGDPKPLTLRRDGKRRSKEGIRTFDTHTQLTADAAIDIFKLYIGNNEKVEFRKGSMRQTMQLIGNQPEDGGVPLDSTVVVACGDKDDDISRFKFYDKYKREDVELEFDACPIDVKHGKDYLDLLNQNPEIKEKLNEDFENFHASDFRKLLTMYAVEGNEVALQLAQDFVPDNFDAATIVGKITKIPTVDEAGSMAGGSVAGYSGPLHKKDEDDLVERVMNYLLKTGDFTK